VLSSAYFEKRLFAVVRRKLLVVSRKRMSLRTQPSGLPLFVIIGSESDILSLVFWIRFRRKSAIQLVSHNGALI